MYAFQNVQRINCDAGNQTGRISGHYCISNLMNVHKKKQKIKRKVEESMIGLLFKKKKNNSPSITPYAKHAPSLSEIHKSDRWLCLWFSITCFQNSGFPWVSFSWASSRLSVFQSTLNICLGCGFLASSCFLCLDQVFSSLKTCSLKRVLPESGSEQPERNLPTGQNQGTSHPSVPFNLASTSSGVSPSIIRKTKTQPTNQPTQIHTPPQS